MKQKQSIKIRPTQSLVKHEDTERKSELKAINRILDRRYDVLVELK
jgi:hypothetical protein